MDIVTNQTVIEIQPQPTTTIELITNPVEIKGDDGRSAYQVAVDNGFVGTEQDWLNSFLQRENHLGTQPISTIENLQDGLDSKANNSDIGVTIQPYDANLVTYSQAEKDKLASIQEGAEVNINADWNAVTGDAVILNKPVLGTIASRNSDEFATAEQGTKADTAVQPNQIANFETTTQLNARDTANKDRTNHTGTQAISTITGLQTALDGKQPTGDYATNTALTQGLATKEPNIITGTTGQYWRGDKTWQTLDKSAVGLSNVDNTSDLSKPISTATQTALDLKANLASPTFTGNLTLPNNTRINSIEHFYQTSKPTVRRDGSALVIGDRWWKTDDGTEWYWNGTYWLGARFTLGNGISVTDMSHRVGTRPYGLFLHYIEASGRVATDPPNWNASNYWQCNLFYGGGNIGNLARLDSTSGYVGGADAHFYRRFDYNQVVVISPSTAGGGLIIFSQIRSVGSPTGTGAGSSGLGYYFTLSFIFP